MTNSARSVGPYSMVTQRHSEVSSVWWTTRFGEWKFGPWKLTVLNVLQEILTYKSDDIQRPFENMKLSLR